MQLVTESTGSLDVVRAEVVNERIALASIGVTPQQHLVVLVGLDVARVLHADAQ